MSFSIPERTRVVGLAHLPPPFEHVIMHVDADDDGQFIYRCLVRRAREDPVGLAADLVKFSNRNGEPAIAIDKCPVD